MLYSVILSSSSSESQILQIFILRLTPKNFHKIFDKFIKYIINNHWTHTKWKSFTLRYSCATEHCNWEEIKKHCVNHMDVLGISPKF